MNRSAPQQVHVYFPGAKCLSYFPMYAGSVPHFRVTLNSSSFNTFFHSLSGTFFGFSYCFSSLFIAGPFLLPIKRNNRTRKPHQFRKINENTHRKLISSSHLKFKLKSVSEFYLPEFVEYAIDEKNPPLANRQTRCNAVINK